MRYFALDVNDNIMSYTNAADGYHYDYSTSGVTSNPSNNVYNYDALTNALDHGTSE